jgi:hypothetical protein
MHFGIVELWSTLMLGNLESMDTKATGIDEAPVQAYKYRSCGKNVITNQQYQRTESAKHMPKAKSFSVPKVQNIQHKEILLPTT